ncbi:MAG: hypothetical protein Q4615_10640 [Paracoccus aminovorans]|nr:hypothetical protein [Paracoccus aminovorans]
MRKRPSKARATVHPRMLTTHVGPLAIDVYPTGNGAAEIYVWRSHARDEGYVVSALNAAQVTDVLRIIQESV